MLRNGINRCVALVVIAAFFFEPVNIVMANGGKTASKTPLATWDVAAASDMIGQRAKKPYTLMVYMNGSDLESESGAATDDLVEMLDAGLDARNAHLILFTGGTNRWQNDVVPANECVLWEIADGWLYEITGVGAVNMGDPGTLSAFLQFGLANYPADRYGLIMWDHGGGSIAGYGHDEKFINGNLTLSDMSSAFEDAGLKNTPLEFLGFDSCLMATVEMAVIASDYARYLIASEDLEPGDGWDYHFLSMLNHNPSMDGKTLGVAVVDAFMTYYGADSDEILSLSVTDTAKARQVMAAMGSLMAPCSDALLRDRTSSFLTLAKKRNNTKTFGEGSPRDNECDMVDIGDMAAKLSDLFPAEATAVINALDDSVIYNRHNSYADLRGLSTYYIYGGKAIGKPALDTYAELSMNRDYTQYLYRFFDALTGRVARNRSSAGRSGTGEASLPEQEIIKTEQVLWRSVGKEAPQYEMIGLSALSDEPAANRLWPKLQGYPVCLFPINRSAQNQWYAIPARVNGRECDIIVLINERHPDGWVEGIRNNDGIIIQKGFDPIQAGDRIQLLYMMQPFSALAMSGDTYDSKDTAVWRESVAFKASEPLTLSWESPENSLYVDHQELFESLRLTDVQNNIYFTEPVPLALSGYDS